MSLSRYRRPVVYGEGVGEDRDTVDPEVAMQTGIRDQWLVVSGWFASHADSGTRGSHVHLSTNDTRKPVHKTSPSNSLTGPMVPRSAP